MKTQNLQIYRIQKGDTLNSIANKYSVSPTEILVQNAVTPKQIKEGFYLQIIKK